eukprot:scaffold596322_cov42-Prasinocladus_malaysianus.AAC.1
MDDGTHIQIWNPVKTHNRSICKISDKDASRSFHANGRQADTMIDSKWQLTGCVGAAAWRVPAAVSGDGDSDYLSWGALRHPIPKVSQIKHLTSVAWYGMIEYC